MSNAVTTRPVVCNVCGSSDSKPLFSAIDRLHGFEGTFQYVQCRQCGLVYMNPQIVPEQLHRFYPDDYAPHQPKERTGPGEKKKLKLPACITGTLGPQSKVLDVGCGRGTFLYRMREHFNCQVFGVDISENAVNCAKNQYDLDVFCGQIFDAPHADNTFDLVTGWACIEHFPDPDEVVKKLYALCRPGGYLLIKTANADSWAARWFKEKWFHLDCPRHLHLFSGSNLEMLLSKCGFDAVESYYDTSSKGFRASLDYLSREHRFAGGFKMLASPISRLAAAMKKSDMITLTARKK